MLRKPAMALSAGFVLLLVAQASPAAQAAEDGRKYKMLTAPLVLRSTAGKRSRATTRYYSGPVNRFSQGQRTRWSVPCSLASSMDSPEQDRFGLIEALRHAVPHDLTATGASRESGR